MTVTDKLVTDELVTDKLGLRPGGLGDRFDAGATPAIVVASGVQGLAVTRGLGERGVPVVVVSSSADDLASASRYAAQVVRTAIPDDGTDAFLDAVLALAPRYRCAVLLATSDGAVKDLSRAHERLAPHFRLTFSPWDVTQRFVDKLFTYEAAERIGVPIPRTVSVTSRRELEHSERFLRFPCLIKPRQSHLYYARFQRKVTTVHSVAELRRAYDEAAEAGLDVVVQELVDGPDSLGVNYNAHRVADLVVAECTARKVRLSPPRFGAPRVVRSGHVPDVIGPGRALLEALGVQGFACTEFKYDRRDRTYKLFEVNGRYNLSSLLSIRSGVNFPWIAYQHALGRAEPMPVGVASGLYWIDEYSDLSASAGRAGRDGQSARELARPWLRPHVFAVFDRRDPAPSALVAKQLVAGAGRRLPRPVSTRSRA